MFGGKRDSAWTHIRVDGGSKEEARALLPAARLLLGKVKESVASTGIGVLQVRKPIAGGGELVARMIGAIPHVTIKLPRFPPKDADRVVLDGFVCWPRNEEHPEGVGDVETDTYDYPQMVLSPPSTRARQRKWWAFLYERFDGFWQGVKGSKEVYKTRGAVDLLPSGLRFYGNHHWRGRDGVILSWYGPETGAIVNGVEAFIFLDDDPDQVFDYPQAFYGSKVYHFGRELVDVSAFPGTTRLYVGGACIRKIDGVTWLYVAQWEGADEGTFFRAFSVYRYRVTPSTPRPGFIEAAVDVLDPEVRELVFSATLPTAAPEFGRAWHHPIRFNQSGTKLLVYVPAADPRRVATYDLSLLTYLPYPETTLPPGQVFRYMATYAYYPRDARIEYDVDSGDHTIEYLQLFTNLPGSGPIAGDYRNDEVVEIKVEANNGPGAPYAPEGSASAGHYLLGEQRIPIAEQSGGAAVRRDIVSLAPADGRALFLRTNLSQPPNQTSRVCALELWGESGLIAEWGLGEFDGSGRGFGSTFGRQLSFGDPDWRQYVHRPFDALSPSVRTDSLTAYGADGAQDPYPVSAVIAPIYSVETLSVNPYTSNAGIHRRGAEIIFNPYPADGYQPFLPAANHRVRYTTHGRQLLTTGEFVFVDANGGFHGDVPDNEKKLSTRALVRHEDYTLVSFARPGEPDETVVRLVPDGRADFLTGLDDTGLRLHPASLFGTPVFRTA